MTYKKSHQCEQCKYHVWLEKHIACACGGKIRKIQNKYKKPVWCPLGKVEPIDQESPPPIPKESDITKQIRSYLNLMGIPHWKIWQGAMSFKGISDILGVLPPDGKFLAIEVKRPGRKPTERQRQFLEQVASAGGIAIVAYSVEDVAKKLKEYFNNHL